MFDVVNARSHPGVRALVKLLVARVVWLRLQNMKLEPFLILERHFDYVDIDLA